MKQKQAAGHGKKHTGTRKHAAAGGKHHPAGQHAHHQPAHHGQKTAHVKAKHPQHAKAHKLAGGPGALADVACCSALALGASLRLSGRPCGADDILALYLHTADSPDQGAPVWRTLEAAYAHGLAGVRPVSFDLVDPDDPSAVILGVDLPGPHAVLTAYGFWWSWGELHDPAVSFPDAVIEEAWAVTWP